MSNSNQSRDRILAAAGPIFAKQGFAKTTVRQICQAADVNVASINYHFGDKKKLYQETLELAQKMREREFPLPQFTPQTPPAKKLQIFLHTALQRMLPQEQERWESRLLMREALHPSDASHGLIENYFKPYFGLLLGIIDELAEGRLSPDQKLQIGVSIMGQCLIYRTSSSLMYRMLPIQNSTAFQLQALCEQITLFSLAGIQAIANTHGTSATVELSVPELFSTSLLT